MRVLYYVGDLNRDPDTASYPQKFAFRNPIETCLTDPFKEPFLPQFRALPSTVRSGINTTSLPLWSLASIIILYSTSKLFRPLNPKP